MENFVPRFGEAPAAQNVNENTEQASLIEEAKKRRSEGEVIEDKYVQYSNRIKRKNEEIAKINSGAAPQHDKTMNIRIKKVEIEIIEKELQIAKLREERIRLRKESKM